MSQWLKLHSYIWVYDVQRREAASVNEHLKVLCCKYSCFQDTYGHKKNWWVDRMLFGQCDKSSDFLWCKCLFVFLFFYNFARAVSVHDDTFKSKLRLLPRRKQKTPLLRFKHVAVTEIGGSIQRTLSGIMIFPAPLCLSLMSLFPLILWLILPSVCVPHSVSVFRSLSQSRASYLHMPHWTFTLSSCSVASCSLR